MDILLIAVIFIILLAIAALFALKRLQAKKSDLPKSPGLDKYLKVKKAKPVAPVTSEAITEALSQAQPKPEPIQETVAPQAVKSPTHELSNIDTHIHNQNYDDAIGELKRLLMINPHHNEAMLKLLQVYGITKKYNTFNQLYEKIRSVADQQTVAEANFLKTLIDDEIAEQTSATAKPEILPTPKDGFDTLEFAIGTTTTSQSSTFDVNTIENTETSSHQNPTNQAAQNSIDDDFDVMLDEPIILETSIDNQSIPDQAASDFDDLVLDFDVGTPTAQTTNTQTDSHQSKQPNDIGNIFDLSNPKKFNDTTDVKKAITEFELDDPVQNVSGQPVQSVTHTEFASFDKPSFDLTISETPNHQHTQKATTTSESFDDLDFVLDFDKAQTPTQNPQTTSQEDDLLFDDLDFVIEDNQQIKQPTETSHQTPIIADDLDETLSDKFDLQDLTLDDSPTSSSQAADTTNDELSVHDLSDSFDFSKFSLNFDTVDDLDNKTDTPTVTADTSDLDTVSFDDDFGFVTEQPTDGTSVPTETTEQTTEAAHRVFNIQITPTDSPQAQPLEVAPPTVDSSVTDLDFVSELDNTQVTLDLAQQYLQMGEYDSAKRLLEEVAQTGNDQQQLFAQQLITRLG